MTGVLWNLSQRRLREWLQMKCIVAKLMRRLLKELQKQSRLNVYRQMKEHCKIYCHSYLKIFIRDESWS